MQNQIVIAPAQSSQRETIIELLQSENLPVKDLPQDISGFLTATGNGFVIGAVALELYGTDGLLRSLVVHPTYRGLGVAAALIDKLEHLARQHSLSHLFLLTETAQGYFAKKGYDTIIREKVPATIQQSTEFSSVCPVSAMVMVKAL